MKEGELRGKRQLRKEQEKQKGTDQGVEKCKQYAVLPYIKGVTKRLQRAFRKHNIDLYAKAGFTIRNAVVSPLLAGEQCGVIYECACDVCGEFGCRRDGEISGGKRYELLELYLPLASAEGGHLVGQGEHDHCTPWP